MKFRITLIFLAVLAALGLSGCSRSTDKAGDAVKLSKFQNGIVYYYTDRTDSKELRNAMVKSAKAKGASLLLLNLDKPKDKKQIDEYQKDNAVLIANYEEVRRLEKGLLAVKKTGNTDSEALSNQVQMDYKKALNLVKETKPTAAQNMELSQLVESLSQRQQLTVSELNRLLDLQRSARLSIPLYSVTDGDDAESNLPSVKVIYEGNVRKTLRFGTNPVPADILKDSDKLEKYLDDTAWFGNFRATEDVSRVEKKLKNKENFVLLLYGNSCSHCQKLMPYLDRYEEEQGWTEERIDTFLEKNNREFQKLIDGKKYGIPEIKWVPTLIAFQKGVQVAQIGIYDISAANSKATLGYDIQEDKLLEFLKKYAENALK